MDLQTLRIVGVLAALPEDARVELAREILPPAYAVVPRIASASVAQAFQATAMRIHKGLRSDFRFNPVAIGPCWNAMVSVAAQVESPAAGAASPSESAG
jgi:hypothetical protein